MSAARTNFYTGIEAFAHALDSPDLTSKDPLIDKKHNEKARLLRNGLAVSSFAIVEEFIKERTGEVLEKIGEGITPFAELPDGLKTAATVGVAEAMLFQAKYIDSASLLLHYQNNANMVASTYNAAYKISKIAFYNNSTNILAPDVERILAAFRVEAPWNSIGSIISKIGQGVLAPKQSFENASKRRNLAAHKASADTEHSSLSGYVKEAIMFCLAYDLLISKALRLISIKDNSYLKHNKLAGSSIEIRSIKPGLNGQWREEKFKAGSRAKIGSNYDDIKRDCLLRANREGFAVIRVTELGSPVEWFTPEVDF